MIEQAQLRKSTAQPIRRLDIQGLRAVAVLSVIAFHARLPISGGFIGVDVFFVISGFVITAMLYREWVKTGGINFSRFYGRRFRRLSPALSLVICTTIVLSTLLASPLSTLHQTALTALGATAFIANFVIAANTGGYFHPDAAMNPLLNTWSLSVEEQFYALFPLLLLFAWIISRKLRTGRWIPILVVFGVLGVSLAIALVTSSGAYFPHLPVFLAGFYGPAGRAWEFASGALLALLLERIRPLSGWLATSLGICGAALLVTGLLIITGESPFPGPMTLVPVIATVLLLIAGSNQGNLISKGLSLRPMVAVGDISYSWYLWHWPLIVLSVLVWPSKTWLPIVAALLSLAPALMSFFVVEQPLRRISVSSRRLSLSIILATVLPALVLSLSLLVSDNHGFWSPRVGEFQQAVGAWGISLDHGCDNESGASEKPQGTCVWNENAMGAPIYLVGDSNAIHFSDGMVQASTQLARPLLVSTASGCPFVNMEMSREKVRRTWSQDCRAFVSGTLDWLKASKPGTVVISLSDQYWRDSEYSVRDGQGNENSEPSLKNAAFREALTRIVKEIQSYGDRVVLIQTVPRFVEPGYDWSPYSCSVWSVISDHCRAEAPRVLMEADQSLTRNAVNQVAAETGASVLDFYDFFCPAGECTTEYGHEIRYRDGGHISVLASLDLAPKLAEALRSEG